MCVCVFIHACIGNVSKCRVLNKMLQIFAVQWTGFFSTKNTVERQLSKLIATKEARLFYCLECMRILSSNTVIDLGMICKW